MAGELATAYVQIIPSAKGMAANITKELGGEADKAGSLFGKNLVGKIKTALATAGIGKVISASLTEGAALQQNLGGVAAVFGDFASSITTAATDAYKKMGSSASDYMATANKMGSLFQGSGLTQQRSLELTTQAMQRAADVASVMGIDTSFALESIAGAAKGNFTMMDNLGVAMNATTLAAYALEKGVNFDWNTASNAEKAELAMQMFFEKTEQYAGNFEREAAETFSGAFEAMKASAKNVLGNLMLGEDIQPSLDVLFETATTFLMGNFLPAIGNILSGIPQIVLSLGGSVADSILQLFGTDLETVLGELETIFAPLKESLGGLFDVVSEKAAPVVEAFQGYVDSGAAASDATSLLKAALEAISGILTTAVDAVTGFVQWLDSGSTSAEVFKGIVVGIVTAFAGWKTISTVTGFLSNMMSVVGLAKTAITGLFGVLMANPFALFVSLIAGAVAAVIYLWNNCEWFRDVVTEIWNAVVETWTGFCDNISEDMESLGEFLSDSWDALTGTISGAAKAIWDFVKEAFTGIVGNVSDDMADLKSDISEAWNNVKSATSEAWNNVKDSISTGIENAKSTVSSTLDSIGKKFTNIWNDAKKTVSGAIDKIKGLMNFSWSLPKPKLPRFSVSGGQAPWGFMGKGSMPKISISWYKDGGILNGATIFGMMGGKFLGGGEAGAEAVLPLSEFYRELENILTRRVGPAQNSNDRSGDQFVFHIYGAEGQDVDELADAVMQKLQFAVSRKELSLTSG